jgi:hypothetical protein
MGIKIRLTVSFPISRPTSFSVCFLFWAIFQEGVVLRSLQIEKTKGREIDWTRFFFVFIIIIHARTLIYTRPQKTFFVVNHRG